MSHERRIAKIDAHKVSTGETLASIAGANGMTWQELTLFNWGTTDPRTINDHLRQDVGCRKTRPGSETYVFDSGDVPGEIFVPHEWAQAGLTTDQTHTIRVRRLEFDPSETVIRLFDRDGHALAGAAYAIVVNRQVVRRGKADAEGDVVIPAMFARVCTVKWARPGARRGAPPGLAGEDAPAVSDDIDPEFEFARDVFLDAGTKTTATDGSDEAARRRLHNMGYDRGHSLAENVRAFQRDVGQTMTGEVDEAHAQVFDCHDEKWQPPADLSGAGTSA